jgi:hypothetical protein
MQGKKSLSRPVQTELEGEELDVLQEIKERADLLEE